MFSRQNNIIVFQNEYLYFKDICTPAKCLLNIWSKYLPKSKFKTNSCLPCSIWTVGIPLPLGIKVSGDELVEFISLSMNSNENRL